MSIATVPQAHRFSRPIAMAAAATVVVIGGVTAVGIASSQDGGTTAPVAPARAPDACRVSACMPSAHGGTSGGQAPQLPVHGGHTVTGQL
jgi:hypothetical protein